MTDDPYEGVAPVFELVADWLARSDGANIPLELAAYELRSRGDWRLSIYRTGPEIEGVGIVTSGAHWFLEAHGVSAAIFLANAAAIHGRRPATLITTERVGELIRPVLSDKGAIGGEHKLRTLRCTMPLAVKEGRWATNADVPSLKRYEEQIDREQRERMDTSWEGLIARTELAVFASNDAVMASIRRYGPAPSFAAIADLFVLPEAGHSQIATQLTGFAVGEILAQRKAVYVFVDESDAATLEFYGALGFEDLGTCYKADLT